MREEKSEDVNSEVGIGNPNISNGGDVGECGPTETWSVNNVNLFFILILLSGCVNFISLVYLKFENILISELTFNY